jgi:hypothetical protein
VTLQVLIQTEFTNTYIHTHVDMYTTFVIVTACTEAFVPVGTSVPKPLARESE